MITELYNLKVSRSIVGGGNCLFMFILLSGGEKMVINTIYQFINILILVVICVAVIYLFLLLVRALKKYIKTKSEREEKK